MDALNADLPTGVRVFAGIEPNLPLRAWYVSVAHGEDSGRVEVLVSDDPEDRRETVSSFAADTGACVVINGGYFTMERTPAVHVGLLVVDGVVEAPATRSVVRDDVRYPTARAALGLTPAGFDIAWVASREGSLDAWSTPPPHRRGAPVELDLAAAVTWTVDDALGAGPALVSNGEINVTTDEEVFFGTAIPYTHPRTAAGVTADGKLLLMLVDGRQRESRGVRLEELAAIMVGIGAEEALNLDGGGSSSLVVNGKLLNNPAGRVTEREVMTALGVFCDRDKEASRRGDPCGRPCRHPHGVVSPRRATTTRPPGRAVALRTFVQLSRWRPLKNARVQERRGFTIPAWTSSLKSGSRSKACPRARKTGATRSTASLKGVGSRRARR